MFVPVPASPPSQINQPEPVERLDSQERDSQDRWRMLELQKKIQELEISLQEAKAKQAVLPLALRASRSSSTNRYLQLFPLEQKAELCVFLKTILLPHLLSFRKF
jgi:hypothetical protein